jgi:hypothetical protein
MARDTAGTPTGDHEFQEQVAWVRAALRCHDILKLRNAASARLTPGRFVYNILRSPENTRLRIRPDPEQAYRRFCGPGTSPEVGALRSGSDDAGPPPAAACHCACLVRESEG